MEACGTVSKCRQTNSVCVPRHDNLHSSALNFIVSNSISKRVSAIVYCKPVRPVLPFAISSEPRALSHQLPVFNIQLPKHFPRRAQCQSTKNRTKQELESQGRKGFGWFRRAAASRRPFVGTSDGAHGHACRDGRANSAKKEHAEQLEEFYSENMFLFMDEKWGALDKDEDSGDGISPCVKEKLRLLLAAGRVQKGSRVLVWGGSAEFVQELLRTTSPAAVVVTHFSSSVLGTVKEMNDDVICWLGHLEDLPDSYGPFDSVFLNSVMTTALSPGDLLGAVASLCNHGAKIVIGCSQGKTDVIECRERNPQLILQSLPDEAYLRKIIEPLPLNLLELRDKPSFYLATLEVEVGDTSTPMHSQHASGEKSMQQRFPLRARGHIVQGFGRGSKQMGVPTANMDHSELPSHFLELPKGVYFGWAQQHGAEELDGGVYKMLMNIGNRPTFADGEGITVEVHILHEFSRDFYNKELSIIVLGFIRAEMRFASLTDLVERIEADITNADQLLDEDEMRLYASDDFFVGQ